jgi:hypothetical protein
MRVTRRSNWVGVAGLTAATAVLSAMIMAAVINLLPRFSTQAAPASDEMALRRYGEIIIPGENPAQCRYLHFDNKTGAIIEAAPDKCRGQFSPDDLNSTENRMSAIRRAFSDH